MSFYYSLIYRVVGTISLGSVLSFGLIGNLLVVVVVIFSRAMHTPTNCFLVSLSVADMVTLLSTSLPTLSELHHKMLDWRLGSAMCPLLIFLQYFSANASAFSITCFSFERWLAICRPMTVQVICTFSRALKIVVGIWVFNFCYNSSWFYFAVFSIKPTGFNSSNTFAVCTYRMSKTYMRFIFLSDLIIFYIVPLVVTSVLYVDIIQTLLRSRGPNRLASERQYSQAKMVRSKLKVVKMLMMVVILFAILWMPYRVWMVYNNFARVKYLDLWFTLFARCMVYINSAVNPILYNAMSTKFRKAFKNLFVCKRITDSSEYSRCHGKQHPILISPETPHNNLL